MMGGGYMIYMILAMGLSAVGGLVSSRLKSKFKHYSQFRIRSGKTGAQVAREMLDYYGLQDVQVMSSKGFLSDHYNPLKKTVNLSPDVYNGRHILSAAVAAHECGHAVQHDEAYAALGMRSALVPVVKFATTAQQVLLFAAFSLAYQFPIIMLITAAAFGATALFSLVTLPVEFDASKRALVWLDESGALVGDEYDGAKDGLWWAAMTYVAGALSSLILFLFFILQYLGNSRR